MLIFSVHNFILESTRIDLHASVFQKHIIFLLLYISIHDTLQEREKPEKHNRAPLKNKTFFFCSDTAKFKSCPHLNS